MAKKRDIVIGVIIAVVFFSVFIFMGLMFVGIMSGDGDIGFAGMGGNIGVIEAFGVINEPMGREFIKHVEKFSDNNSIKAIVIHINSPGGGVAISQEMYDALNRAREVKPVVSSMASVAASGGYYIACATDRIVANPGTITGSIGVIFQFHTAKDLLDKIGIATETIKSGAMKDVGSYSKEMTEKEGLMLQSVVMDTYEQFVEVVAEGRGKDKEEVYPLADGSIYTGLQAYNLGLVDSLGGLKEAIAIAADLADLSGEPKVVKPVEKKEVGLFDLLGNLSDFFDKAVEKRLNNPQVMYLFQ